jgi:hypothetical protein
MTSSFFGNVGLLLIIAFAVGLGGASFSPLVLSKEIFSPPKISCEGDPDFKN